MAIVWRLVLAVMVWLAASAAHAEDGRSAHIKARLVAASQSVPKNGEVMLAIDYTPQPGWHTYWINPGDTGLAPKVTWNLPDGVTAGDIRWPAPVKLPAYQLMSYGYDGQTTLLVPLHNGSPLGQGEVLPLKAHVDYLVCADICVPESLDVSLNLTVGLAKDSAEAGLIRKAEDALPKQVPLSATVDIRNGMAEFGFQGGEVLDHPQGAWFFPAQQNLIVPSAPQVLDLGPDGFTLRAKAAGDVLPDGKLSGLLRFADGRVYDVTLARAPLAPGMHGLGEAPAVSGRTAAGVVVAMGLAFLGGLILNLMPCVFPVLSMKLLSLARAGHDAGLARREAALYGAGAILSFVALALMLEVAQRLGASLGWGFQLQSPYVTAALSIVMLLVALNMSGVFEIGTSLQSAAGVRLDAKRPMLAAFLTGVLAVVVAAPCTAPFMATAIGVALAQGGLTAFVIFVALGVGFALPFVALTWLITSVPAVARILPRPGTWMTVLKITLSLLMYAAAAWLVWVFAQQVQTTGLIFLVVALAAVTAGVLRVRLPKLAKVMLVVGGLVLSAFAAMQPQASKIHSMPSGLLPHRDFHMATLADLRGQGTPVFVDLTAAWCVTCKVNEKLVLTTPEFARALKDTGTVYMVGDWTNQDTEISRYLTLYGRSGVPLYVYYGPDNAAPVVLPQILGTADVVRLMRTGK